MEVCLSYLARGWNMTHGGKWAGFTMMFLVVLGACAVGGRHTSDSALEENFFRHEEQFEALLADVQADEKLSMIRLKEFRYAGHSFSSHDDLSAAEHDGLTKERLKSYQGMLRDLGVRQVFRGTSGVTFKVDKGSISNGDSYKGYEYDTHPPKHLRASLDGYRISDRERDELGYSVCKRIKGNWYLYLFVNR